MTISMDEVYNVTSFLRGELHVDREYPFNFNPEKNKLINIEPSSKAVLSSDEALVHNNSILFKELYNGDVVLITLPEPRKFDKSDKFEIKIKSNQEINLNDIQVSFSESNTGEPALMTLKPYTKDENIKILSPSESAILFKITEGGDDKRGKKLSNIRSIAISFNQNIDELYLIDAVFKCTNNVFTIEDVEKQLNEAENYIQTKLNAIRRNLGFEIVDDVPEELESLLPKVAAAFIHRIRWQSEGKYQDKRKDKDLNYSDRLLSEVSQDITDHAQTNKNTSFKPFGVSCTQR